MRIGPVAGNVDGTIAPAQSTSTQSAPPDQNTTQSDQGVKSDAREAGPATGRAEKKTAHTTKRTVKKGTNKAAQTTRQGAENVEDKAESNPPQR